VPASQKEYRRWSKEKKVTTQELISGLREEPKRSSVCVRELLTGTYLPTKKKIKNWLQVGLPDGTDGWMPSSSATRSNRNREYVSSEEIISTAKKFLGISYVWGGRSTKGFDCSGLTQTVFRLHGIELPRDASLQWRCGEDVGKDTGEFVEGDLVFFSSRENRITHVGIYLADEESIIHSSGFVRISSLNPSHALYDERLSSIFVGARRLGQLN
jgi:cell wall-associated NlpC family hydrolase